MSKQEVIQLVNEGMYVGSHGTHHYWLNQVSRKEQLLDIQKSLEFLEDIGSSTKDWIMCYPYGAYNNTTLSITKKLGAILGITTEVRKANLALDNQYALPRFDTNDFPQ